MGKERINLFVTKEQLELIWNSVKERRNAWKRTLSYHSGKEHVGGLIEECSDEAEAEYVLGTYEELQQELQSNIENLDINRVESLAVETLEGVHQNIEVFVLGHGNQERVVYALSLIHI